MGKVRITGFEESGVDWGGAYDEDENYIGVVHAHDEAADGERTVCSLDLVHGITYQHTKAALTCKTCIQNVKYYKTIKIGRG